MKKKVKHYLNLLINGVLLKSFNLKLSYSIGSNPVDDMKRLKLDLQGHELQAIQGLGDLLNSVKQIYAEVEFLRLYEERYCAKNYPKDR